MTSRRARWTHEFNTKTHLREAFREFFDMPKILAPLTKLLPEPKKVHRRPYDGIICPHEWPDVFTIRAEFENFYCVSILCQLRDSVAPALTFGTNILKKAARQINDFLRLCKYVRLIYKACIRSGSNSCPLVWPFCSNTSFRQNGKNQFRALRLVYNDLAALMKHFSIDSICLPYMSV